MTMAMELIRHIAGLYSGKAIKGDFTQVYITGNEIWMAQQVLAEQAEGAQEREALPHWPPCNPACDPELNGFRDRRCSCAQARAALAQPSLAWDEVVVTLNDSGAILAVTRQDAEGRVLNVLAEAQPSPAPELPTEDELEAAGLGYPLAKEEAVKLWYAGFRSEVITVLEAWEAIGHDIGMNPDKGELLASLRYMLEKCEAHDAAQARLAELEGQEPVAWVEVIDRDYGPYNFHGKRLLPKGKNQLYAATPAQAQHSVPEGYALIPVRETEAMHDAVMALLYKGVARTDTQKLLDAYIAAAPGKEGV
ncbi:hypothetical protein [Pseudomonas sp. 273]|uniref:hypothetical protein n=1 Tax=Pseudomonas sp. 273 TaxID=75692 RepID=UPI0023D8493A|nr:hypothetical protein [Pseudomonas sp. 273]